MESESELRAGCWVTAKALKQETPAVVCYVELSTK